MHPWPKKSNGKTEIRYFIEDQNIATILEASKKFLVEKEAEIKKEMEKKNDTENASESGGEGDSETVQAG